MADAPVVHIGENSPEKVALDMTRYILSQESQNFSRQRYLDTYAECLLAVRGYRTAGTGIG
jgi:non-homologous end joining protein Ku